MLLLDTGVARNPSGIAWTAWQNPGSGPGRLYLASPLTVAASAVTGEIVEYHDGMFSRRP